MTHVELDTTISASKVAETGRQDHSVVPSVHIRKRGRPVGTTKKTLEELIQSRRESSSRWYFNNHEKKCAQKKKYYEQNRDRILSTRKQQRISRKTQISM